MITEDDARMTLELEDRYAITPPIAYFKPDHLMDAGRASGRGGLPLRLRHQRGMARQSALVALMGRKAA